MLFRFPVELFARNSFMVPPAFEDLILIGAACLHVMPLQEKKPFSVNDMFIRNPTIQGL